MSQSRTIKHVAEAEGSEELLNGSILVALGLSIFLLNEWPMSGVRVAVGLAWAIFLLIIKGPELVRLVRRTE